MKKTLLLSVIIFYCFFAHAQKNIIFKSNLPYPGKALANIWGYVDSQNNEYALVGTQTGISIVDVTNPANPVEKTTVSGPNSQWREIRSKGNFAFVTTEGGGGLQIVDLSTLPGSVTSKLWAPTISGVKLN